MNTINLLKVVFSKLILHFTMEMMMLMPVHGKKCNRKMSKTNKLAYMYKTVFTRSQIEQLEHIFTFEKRRIHFLGKRGHSLWLYQI